MSMATTSAEERAANELEKLRQLCHQQHEALKICWPYMKGCAESNDQNVLDAAIEKYNSMVSK